MIPGPCSQKREVRHALPCVEDLARHACVRCQRRCPDRASRTSKTSTVFDNVVRVEPRARFGEPRVYADWNIAPGEPGEEINRVLRSVGLSV
jgi:hypothetical protein